MVQAIRKVVVFILAIAMLVVGLYVLAQLFIWGHGLFGRSVAIGSFLIGIGVYVLWADFIEPILGMWEPPKLFGIGERRRRAALKRLSLSIRSRAPLSEQRGVKPIPLRVADLEVLRQRGQADSPTNFWPIGSSGKPSTDNNCKAMYCCTRLRLWPPATATARNSNS
jgi:hypothetical protein